MIGRSRCIWLCRLASRDRLRPLIRLILNQIVRTLTTTMTYRNGRACRELQTSVAADAG